ncbi:MAG TPA: sialidase family protein, partial [Longimicrobiaceae bacterium]
MPCPQAGPGKQYQFSDGTDVQVTHSNASQSRSESVVLVNPTNAQNLICASKKFIDPQKYHFTISASYSMDGGQTWTESQPPLQPGWDGMTDPDLTFDALGNAYLIVEPLKFGTDLVGMGMYVFKTTNGGVSWHPPVQLHADSTDDKQWITSDMHSTSPHFGAVYAVWAAGTPLRFSRSTDHGATWQGAGAQPSGSPVFAETAYAPSIAVGLDGTIHITWHIPGSGVIRYTRSTDGGNSFSPPISCVTGMKSLTGSLPTTNGWPHFTGGTFRVLTIVTSCMAAGDHFIVAWADYREGRSRIYFRAATSAGTSWVGPASGEALLPTYGHPDQQHFHPQLAVNDNQAVGCAFYEFGPKGGKYRIDVMAAWSCDDGASWHTPLTVTDKAWDPAVNAPWSHGDPAVTFIGEYFGFDGSTNSFAVLWTDTRTGVQELFFDGAVLGQVWHLPHLPDLVVKILFGVIQDGGGAVLVDGV